MRVLILVVFLALLFVESVFAQPRDGVKISEKQDIAVFSSYYTLDIPVRVVNKLDDGIVNLFVEMRRFNVKGYEFRFSEVNLERFISRVRELQEQKVSKNEIFVDPKWGTITLTPEVFEKLINSFSVVVPNIKSFGVELKYEDGKRYYEVTMGVSLKFFDPTEGRIFHVIDVKETVSGKSDAVSLVVLGLRRGDNLTKEETIDLAVAKVLDELKYQIRKVEKFRLFTTVIAASGGKYLMELGRNFDVNPGLELDLVVTRIVSIGGRERKVSEVAGLVRVVRVEEEFSEVIPVFGEPKVGDQLADALRRGFIFRGFVGVQQVGYGLPSDTSLLSYFRNKWNNLQDDLGIVVGISGVNDGRSAYFEPQIDLSLVIMSPLTITLDFIANYSFYLRNFKAKPHVGFNLLASLDYFGRIDYSGYHSVDLYLVINSIGATMGITCEYLFSKNLGVSLSVGYKYTIPVYSLIIAYDRYGSRVGEGIFEYGIVPDFGLRGFGGNVSLVFRY